MTDFILHHYALSPFSEKLRAMLGHAGLPWASAKTREAPPRPVLAALAGGYRRIPVAQIGADVFCDTKIIAAEIATLSGKPLLAPDGGGAAVADYCRMVDSEVFLCCMVLAGGPRLLVNGLSMVSPFAVPRLIADRIKVAMTSTQRMPGPKAARARLRSHLADAEARLTRTPWLFGEEPSHADFAAYHSLWFLRDIGGSSLVRSYPRVMAWLDRIRGFGDGARHEIAPAQALAAAKEASPRALPAEALADPLIGETVRIAPADYARDATVGTLAGASETRWILRRDHRDLGVLHVHFPKEGYRLDRA